MPIDPAELSAELIRLRKGKSTRDLQLHRQLEPQTKAAFGIADGDSVPTIRAKMTTVITDLIGDDDRRRAVLVALALWRRADHRYLKDRQEYLAGLGRFDDRTARRRIDEGMDELVAAIALEDHARTTVAPEDPPPTAARPDDEGFTVRTFQARMHLDAAVPRLHEKRRIVVTADRLSEIIVRLTLPKADPDALPSDVDVEVDDESGGTITRKHRCSPEHFEFTLRLPQTLLRGEDHEYSLIVRIPEGQLIRPYYVFLPLVSCELFDVEVYFDPARLPERIWLVEGAVSRAIEYQQEKTRTLSPDQNGVVHETFTNLREGRAYGVSWA